MQLKSLVALAVAVAAPVVAAVHLPVVAYVPFVKEGGLTTIPGAADGVYTSYNATHFAYYGKVAKAVNTDAPAVEERATAEKRQNTCNVSCNGQYGTSNDILAAQSGLRNLLANNPSFRGSISYVRNDVWAFGCDYGNGQVESPSQWDFDVACVKAQCGGGQGGWNSHKSWKSTYGRQIGGLRC
ncbi:hypothetical protein Hypma_005967 [Hypsizygus marmoreus]|uniref:Uncharacterized protein n=1 Tax=Hypsizygus marmoreus TaxID=39966 RepID=A0A369K7W6_HYPMA|nr:hypothetical protein Hypma_005967 [Hypsizygus marmoreus]